MVSAVASPQVFSWCVCRVGDPEQGMSAEQSFRTGLAPSAVSFPNRIGLVADLGLTSNSTVTLAHLVANQPDMVIFVGGEKREDPPV